MKAFLTGFTLLLLFFSPVFFHLHGEENGHDHKNEQSNLYTCPMHPQIVQEGPGSCPICGMDLVPAEKKTKKAGSKDAIVIDPAVVQNMGVRIDAVKKGKLFKNIRTYGRVETADNRVSVVNLRFGGWVEKIHADRIGQRVSMGQKLLDIYSPEIFAAKKEYLMALKSYGSDHGITSASREKLILLGIGSKEISEIGDTEKIDPIFTVRSPSSGVIYRKSVVAGSRIMAGKDLYEIHDLSRLWVKAEVYDFDAGWLKKGMPVKIDFTVPGVETVGGVVSYIYPHLNLKSRTVTVRIEISSSKGMVKPGMIATLNLVAERVETHVLVPSEAVLYTGEKTVVFVAEGIGKYAAREIDTGFVGDNGFTEVKSGLEEGENVVVSGQFLLDSESQLREAIEKFRHKKLHGH